jgi:hypothetical protein
MPESAERHLRAKLAHEAAAREHERSAAFWEAQGDPERAALQRDLADHERQGAALERRWAALIERDRRFSGGDGADAAGTDGRGEHDPDEVVDDRIVAVEMRETELTAREQGLDDRDSVADLRDAVADERERNADERERAADLRERVADEREGTAEVREAQRLERLDQGDERVRAARRRQQATVDREVAASSRRSGWRPPPE